MLIYLILLCCLFFSYLTIFVLVLSYLCMYSSLSLYDILMFPSFLFLSICPVADFRPHFLSDAFGQGTGVPFHGLSIRRGVQPGTENGVHPFPQSQWHGFIGWKIWGDSVSIIFFHIFIGLGDCLSAEFNSIAACFVGFQCKADKELPPIPLDANSSRCRRFLMLPHRFAWLRRWLDLLSWTWSSGSL